MNAFEGNIRERIISLAEENKRLKTEIKHNKQLWKTAFRAYKNLKKQMKKEILELREAFETMKVLAIPKAYTDGDYLSTTVLKICEEALKDTEKYIKENETFRGDECICVNGESEYVGEFIDGKHRWEIDEEEELDEIENEKDI